MSEAEQTGETTFQKELRAEMEGGARPARAHFFLPPAREDEQPSEEAQKEREEILNAAYRVVFAGPEGQIVFRDLMAETLQDTLSARAPDFDVNRTFINEGRRYIGQYIKRRARPEYYGPTKPRQKEAISV